MLLIGDQNYREHAAQAVLRDHEAGCLPRQTAYGGVLCAPPASEHIRPLPESEWKDRIRGMQGRFIGDLMRSAKIPCKDQGRLNYCWAYSLAACIEALRLTEGQPYVELAGESLAGDVAYRNAGNSLDSALAYAAEHGLSERVAVPAYSLRTSEWQQGWKTDALLHRPLEWWDLDGEQVWAQTVTALLCGLPVYVGLAWWGHAVMYTGLAIASDGEIVPEFRNSWGSDYGDDGYAQLSGRHKVPSRGSFVPRAATFSTR